MFKFIAACCALFAFSIASAKNHKTKTVDIATTTTFAEVNRPLVFGFSGSSSASLVYDNKERVCRQEGSIEDAFRILYSAYLELADRHSRTLYGNEQVDKWKREQQKLEADFARKAYK